MTSPNIDAFSVSTQADDATEQPVNVNRLIPVDDFDFARQITGETLVMATPYRKEITVLDGRGLLRYMAESGEPATTHLLKGDVFPLTPGTMHKYMSKNGTLTVHEHLIGQPIDLEVFPAGIDLL